MKLMVPERKIVLGKQDSSIGEVNKLHNNMKVLNSAV